MPLAVLGLQHCLAMLIGLITPAQILSAETDDVKTKLYMARSRMLSLLPAEGHLQDMWLDSLSVACAMPHASSVRSKTANPPAGIGACVS